ncbi:hypothetical protein AAVH_03263 [Aphelenchoides avenae]|nr:hypothetical protein AAVH_03263 [Aphelenchus avenae]
MSEEDVPLTSRSGSLRRSLSEDNVSSFLDQSETLPSSQREVLRKLVDRNRDLTNEITNLRRGIPHLRDAAGKDVSEEIMRLADKYEAKCEELEDTAREFEKLKRKYRERKTKADEEKKTLRGKVQEAVERANRFEDENQILREKRERDQSMIFHLQNDVARSSRHHPSEVSDISENGPSSANTTDDLYVLQAESAKRAGENARLREELRTAKRGDPETQGEAKKLEAAERDLQKRNQLLKALIKNQKEAGEAHWDGTDHSERMNRQDEETSSYSGREVDGSNYSGPVRHPRERVVDVSVAFDMTRNLVNRSQAVLGEMATVDDRMRTMKQVCVTLFDRLRETAIFLEELVEKIEHGEGNRSLIEKIRALKLDLDQSMNEADAASKDIKRIRGNIQSLQQLLEQSRDKSALFGKTRVLDKSSAEAEAKPDVGSVTELKRQLEELQRRFAMTEELYISTKAHLEREVAANRELVDENNAACENLRAVEGENAEMRAKISESERRLGSLEKELSDAHSNNALLAKKIQTENVRSEDIKRRLAESEARFDRIRSDYQAQVAAQQAEVQRGQDMASEIASLRDELRRLNEQHRYLQENTTSSRGVRGGQARVLEEFSNKLARAEELNAVLESELKLKNEEAANLASNLRLLKQAHGDRTTAKTRPSSGGAHVRSERPEPGPALKQVETLRREVDESRKMLHDIRSALPSEGISRRSQRFIAQDAEYIVQWIRSMVEWKREVEQGRHHLSEANRLMIQKLKDGAAEAGYPLNMPALGLDDSTFPEHALGEEERVQDFEEFHTFICDCQDRSNKLVQTIKKLEDEFKNGSSSTTPAIMTSMLKQARNLRMMLYKIANYFTSQKENMPHKDLNLGKDIRKQLQDIYVTLQDAGSSSATSKPQRTSSTR